MHSHDKNWIRARVTLINQLHLGVVNLRYLDGGVIEIDDGRRYGSGAWFLIEPLPEQTVLSGSEKDALEMALCAAICEDGERWSIQAIGCNVEDRSIFMCLAKAIEAVLEMANEEARDLRERLKVAEANKSDPRAALVLDALMKLQADDKPATVRLSSTHGGARPVEWNLSINFQPDSVKGSLDDVARYILDMGKPVESPAEAEPVVDSPPPVTPEVKSEGGDDDIPF